ncbi:MAG: DUF1800 domain-containing protein [Dehalococcoidia bacterium]|nr:DUF1800 domain-containing protein [Dehalococcoidia bacterium]
MNENPEPSVPLLQRAATRRAMLAGTAAVAAGGTAAAVVALARRGDGGGTGRPDISSPTPDDAKLAAEALKQPIADPMARAAHLLRRAGWGGTLGEIQAFAELSREEAADRLLNFGALDNAALDRRIAAANFNLSTPGRGVDNQRPLITFEMQRWWLTRMSYTTRPLEERMTYIWHGLLTTQVSILEMMGAKTIIRQNELFRSHALGRYDDLLQAVAKDPAMMIYLNTVDSTAEHPNENFARELMELFSMGEGNYTETDVRESARAFTGWRLTPLQRRPIPQGLSTPERNEFVSQMWAAWQPEWLVDPKLHDKGVKTFLGRTGPFGGEDIISIIMEQPATARFITRRLFGELAYRDPDEETVGRLVDVWQASGHSVRDVVRAILVSDEFYSIRAYRSLVRSPVDFAVGAVRALELETNWRGIERAAATMDQTLFDPPNVAGWPGGETWLSSSTFFGRLNFLDTALFPAGRAAPIPALQGASSPEVLVDEALKRLVDDNISPESRESLYAHARTVTNPQERAAAVAYLVLASPEYQLI